jgi:hypothetical protein
MHGHDQDDHELGDALRRVAPPAPFDRDGLHARIDATVTEREGRAHGAHGRLHGILVWGRRAAAALAIFASGTLVGRASAAPGSDDPEMRYVPATTWGVVPPGQVPMSIQGAGTGYVAALALYSELRDRLTPAQRDQARQAALAVLSGALAELAAAGDGRLPEDVLNTVLRYGVQAGDPVMRYQ